MKQVIKKMKQVIEHKDEDRETCTFNVGSYH